MTTTTDATNTLWIDVREPLEFASGHIPGSVNMPLTQLHKTPLPQQPVVLICQSGKRSHQAVELLRRRGMAQPVQELQGGIANWQLQGRKLERAPRTPLPLMQQVQIAAGSLVLLGLIMSKLLAPGWIGLSWFVGAGLVFAGITGFCGMARLLAVMPWNRLQRR